MITESDGFSRDLRGRLLRTASNRAPVATRRSRRSTRTPSYLASQPICAPGSRARLRVYVTVSVAYPPQVRARAARSARIPDGAADRQRGRHLPRRRPARRARHRVRLLPRRSCSTASRRTSRSARSSSRSTGQLRDRADSLHLSGRRRPGRGHAVVTASHSVVQPTCDPNEPEELLRRRHRPKRRGHGLRQRPAGRPRHGGRPDHTEARQQHDGARGLGCRSDRANGHPITEAVRPLLDLARERARPASSGRLRPQRQVAGSAARLPDEQRRARPRSPQPHSAIRPSARRPRSPTRPLHGGRLVHPDHVDVHARNDVAAGGSAQHDDHAHGRHDVHDRRRST